MQSNTSTVQGAVFCGNQDQSYTIKSWCRKHAISVTAYRNLCRKGLGPTTYKIGRTIRISAQSDRDWVYDQEHPSPGRAAALKCEAEAQSRKAALSALKSLKSPNHISNRRKGGV